MAVKVPSLKLNSGYDIPVIGLGVWRAEKGELRKLIREAIALGYRHFDCAADYLNEAEVGEALAEVLKEGLVRREELFITTKLWNSDHGHVRPACEDSLKKLRVSYLDLYLVHFPIATKHTGVGTTESALADDGVLDIDVSVSLQDTWRAMEGLVEAGLVRSIGISNYDVFLTRDCLAYSKIKPAVNQVEAHVYFPRKDLVRFCRKHGVVVTAHTPLGGGQANADLFGSKSPLEESKVLAIASKHHKAPSQVLLRWGVEKELVVIPKTSKVARLKENIAIFDFSLSPEDLKELDSLDRGARSNNPEQFWGINLFA